MKTKLYKIFKKYKVALIVVLSTFIIGGILLLYENSQTIKKYQNDSYTIVYDYTWKIKSKTNEQITLKHKKGSTITIQITKLNGSDKYLAISDLSNNLLKNIQEQNKSYKLLSTENDTVTKEEYDGVKYLFENNKSQVMVTAYKKEDKLIIFTYQSKNEYFDILLDSVQNIIYNFNTNEKTYKLNYKIETSLSKIKWKENKSISSKLKKGKKDKIANNNYEVSYSLPDNFKLNSFDSTTSNYTFQNLKNGSITLKASINNMNIYSYISKKDSKNLYSSYKIMSSNKKGYSKYQENIEEIKKGNNYIYKNSYKYKNPYLKSTSAYENVELIYKLDNNHIFVIKLESNKNIISKELIDKIKLNSFKNYSSYVKRKVKDGILTGTLKQYDPNDYTKEKIQYINIKLPEKYQEIDKNNNIYTSRNYGLNYSEDNDSYEYEIGYETFKSLDIKINSLKKELEVYQTNENYHKLIESQSVTLNDKKFIVYDGAYTTFREKNIQTYEQEKYYINFKTLIYEINENSYIAIKIKANNSQISGELLNEITNFDIQIK